MKFKNINHYFIKAIIVVLYMSIMSISLNSYASEWSNFNDRIRLYPNKTPTEVAKQTRASNCDGLKEVQRALLQIIDIVKDSSTNVSALSFVVGEDNQTLAPDFSPIDFHNNSWVESHADYNNDGINDFAVGNSRLKNVNCNTLLGQNIAGSDYYLSRNGYYISSQEINARRYSENLILSLKGCKTESTSSGINLITGTTYQKFSPERYNECKGGIIVHYGNETKCLTPEEEKKYLKNIDGREVCANFTGNPDYYICAFEYAGMICAEAMVCDYSNFFDSLKKGIGEVMPVAPGLQMKHMYPRTRPTISGVAGGADTATYNGFDLEAKYISCKNHCKVIEEGKFVCDDLISNKADCKICDPLSCIFNAKGVQCINAQNYVCGYSKNKKYLAHCVPRPQYKNFASGTNFLSPYCSNKASIKTRSGSSVTSFTGRGIRCIDQTMANLFYGTSQRVENEQVQILCPSSTSAGDEVIETRKECRNEGFFSKFSNNVENIVTIILTIFFIFKGISLIFGQAKDIKSLKEIAKYGIIIAVIIFFVKGDAWKDHFYDFAMSLGSNLIFIADIDDARNLSSETDAVADTMSNVRCIDRDVNDDNIGIRNIIYKDGEEGKYAIWDMLDCRIFTVLYDPIFGNGVINFFINMVSSNILIAISVGLSFIFLIIIMYYLFSAKSLETVNKSAYISIVGVVMMLLFFVAPIFLLFFVIFLLSFQSLLYISVNTVVIFILIFVSPLIIPLKILPFSRTKEIFKQWLETLVGHSLVPLILFFTIYVCLHIFDFALYGSSLNDFFQIDALGNASINEECDISKMMCFMSKFTFGKVQNFNEQFSTFTNYLIVLANVVIPLLLAFALFIMATQQLISKILGVSLPNTNIALAVMNLVSGVKDSVSRIYRKANQGDSKKKNEKAAKSDVDVTGKNQGNNDGGGKNQTEGSNNIEEKK